LFGSVVTGIAAEGADSFAGLAASKADTEYW
jgi:hypothetical protein